MKPKKFRFCLAQYEVREFDVYQSADDDRPKRKFFLTPDTQPAAHSPFSLASLPSLPGLPGLDGGGLSSKLPSLPSLPFLGGGDSKKPDEEKKLFDKIKDLLPGKDDKEKKKDKKPMDKKPTDKKEEKNPVKKLKDKFKL